MLVWYFWIISKSGSDAPVVLRLVCSSACLKNSSTQANGWSQKSDKSPNFRERKETPWKERSSLCSFGTRNKSGLSVVLITQCLATPGVSTHRSLMLQFWGEGTGKWQALYLIYSDLHMPIRSACGLSCSDSQHCERNEMAHVTLSWKIYWWFTFQFYTRRGIFKMLTWGGCVEIALYEVLLEIWQ